MRDYSLVLSIYKIKLLTLFRTLYFGNARKEQKRSSRHMISLYFYPSAQKIDDLLLV